MNHFSNIQCISNGTALQRHNFFCLLDQYGFEGLYCLVANEGSMYSKGSMALCNNISLLDQLVQVAKYI